jgi:hypothetical protein
LHILHFVFSTRALALALFVLFLEPLIACTVRCKHLLLLRWNWMQDFAFSELNNPVTVLPLDQRFQIFNHRNEAPQDFAVSCLKVFLSSHLFFSASYSTILVNRTTFRVLT